MRRRLGSTALEIWLPVLTVAAWWFLSAKSTSPWFPPLREIMRVFVDTWFFEGTVQHVMPSMRRFAIAYGGAIIGAVSLGLLMGMWSLARRSLAPTVDFLRSIPGPAIISVMIIVVGFGDRMNISAIMFTSFWPILLNTIDGVRGVDIVQLEMASVYRLRRMRRIRSIILPAASPQIFSGLRISLAVALALMVFSEMLGGRNGLGFFILYAQETYRITDMWAGIVLLGILGYLINLIFVWAEGRILSWHRGWQATSRDTKKGAAGG